MEIKHTIQKVISSYVDGRLIQYDDLLIENGIDSVLMIEIVMELEEKFNIEFDPAQLNYKTLKSIRTISEYIQSEIGVVAINE